VKKLKTYTLSLATLAFVLAGNALASSGNGAGIPGGFNSQFSYGVACQKTLAYRKGCLNDAKKCGSLLRLLDEDVDALNAQLKIITNSEEEKDFRLDIMRTAEGTRQSVVYSLAKLTKVRPALASRINAQCSLMKIQHTFKWSNALREELLGGN
jgi:hypothetical protein